MNVILTSRSYSFEVTNENTGEIYDLVVNLPEGVTRSKALGQQIERSVQTLANRIFSHDSGAFAGADEISCDLLANDNFFDLDGETRDTSNKVHAQVKNGNLFDSLAGLKRIITPTLSSPPPLDDMARNRTAVGDAPRSFLGNLFGGHRTTTANPTKGRFKISLNSLLGRPQTKESPVNSAPSIEKSRVEEALLRQRKQHSDESSSDIDIEEDSNPEFSLELDAEYSVSFSRLNHSLSFDSQIEALPSVLEHPVTDVSENEDSEDEEEAQTIEQPKDSPRLISPNNRLLPTFQDEPSPPITPQGAGSRILSSANKFFRHFTAKNSSDSQDLNLIEIEDRILLSDDSRGSDITTKEHDQEQTDNSENEYQLLSFRRLFPRHQPNITALGEELSFAQIWGEDLCSDPEGYSDDEYEETLRDPLVLSTSSKGNLSISNLESDHQEPTLRPPSQRHMDLFTKGEHESRSTGVLNFKDDYYKKSIPDIMKGLAPGDPAPGEWSD